MSQREATINHCDICTHEWVPRLGVVYTHCTSGKCRSRKWNNREVKSATRERFDVSPMRAAAIDRATGTIYLSPATPVNAEIPVLEILPLEPLNINLRDMCSGKISIASANELYLEPVEIPICGHKWWEDGANFECLMDKGHKTTKHGQRGMARRLDD